MDTPIAQQPQETLATLRQAIDKALDEAFAQPLDNVSEDGDPLNSTTLYQTDQHYLIKTGLPGVDPDQIEVVVHNDQVMIRAEAIRSSQNTQDSATRLEQTVERYYRSIGLPGAVNLDEARAVMEGDVLRITLPRVPALPPKRLVVERGPKSETLQ